mgnify:CR=1 FL=1
MEVFISWSGKRSKIFAELFYDFVKRTLHPLKPWMSSVEIQKGQRWSKEIGDRLSKDMIGVICITPENQDSQWLLFEAGAISKVIDNARVCPVLIGMDKKDLKGPLSQFQAASIEKNDMFELLSSLNDLLGEYKREKELLKQEFEDKWKNFKTKLDEKFKAIKFTNTSRILPQFIDVLQESGLPEPEIGKTINFKEGFESHTVYEAVFSNATERVYIFGRKNRKVFDKEHWSFYKGLQAKLKIGFDFRCLFLDPDSPHFILDVAHQDEDFKLQLNTCINNAISTLNRFELPTSDIIRKYHIQRTFEIIIVDDAVLFTPIQFDETGKAVRLTKSSFTITNVYTNQGKSMLDNFLNTWNTSKIIQ